MIIQFLSTREIRTTLMKFNLFKNQKKVTANKVKSMEDSDFNYL